MAAGRMNVVMLMVMVVVTSMQLQGSKAQTNHVVGDSTGWNVPSSTSFYTTWASSQTFTVGDVLVFNFVTGAHNVAEVNRSGYDACNGTSPISMTTNGPANINLPAAGTRYFICTVGSHCTLGQRLAINISAATSTPPPAAQPATPPSATPTPVSPPSATPTPVSPPSPTPAPISPPSPAPVSPLSPGPSATPAPDSPPSARTPPPGTTPAPSSPNVGDVPPPPNSATSVAATALPVALLSIALAFLN